MSCLATQTLSSEVPSARSQPCADEQTASRMRQIRVTHVVWNFDGGGLESVVASLARRFRHSEIRTSVISLSGRIGRLGLERRGDFDEVLATRPWRGISNIAPIGLARLIRRTQAYVVHLHSGVWFKGALAARLAGVRRVIFTEHGREHNDPLSSRLQDAAASRLTDVVVPVSPRLESYLHRRLCIPMGRLCTIPNGIDTDAFTPGTGAAVRGELEIPGEALVIGSVSRLSSVKRFDHLMACLPGLIRHEDPCYPVYLVICGEGPEEAPLREQAARLGVLERVRMLPWRSEPRDVYRALDVFILPSKSEGLSMSLLESMACGLPSVVTDVGANREVLGTQAASQVVPPEDDDALTSAIDRLLHDSQCRLEAGRRARLRVENTYSLARVTRAYAELYRAGAREEFTRQ